MAIAKNLNSDKYFHDPYASVSPGQLIRTQIPFRLPVRRVGVNGNGDRRHNKADESLAPIGVAGAGRTVGRRILSRPLCRRVF